MPVGSLDIEYTEEVEEVEEQPSVGGEQSIEQAFVANLLARPDLLPAVQPDMRSIGDGTVRAMLQIVATHGAAYCTPITMLSALDSLPQPVDGEVANQVLMLVPEPEDVELGLLLKLKTDVEAAAASRVFKQRVDRALARYGKVSEEEILSELRAAIEWYDKKQVAELDLTAEAGLERLKNDPPKVRWKIGSIDLDEPFKGIGPDGKSGYGMLGQGEVTVLAAPYGVGKSRVTYNWGGNLLDQGASVDWVILEDDEFAIMTNLMAVTHDVETWKIEQFIRGELGFIGADAAEHQARLEKAIAWYKDLGKRIRTIDGSNTKVNVFNLDELLALLTLNKRLYGTTHVVIDYVQALEGGEDTEEAQRLSQKLRAFAGRNKIGLIEVSQVSNETMKWGSVAGQVAAKGSSSWGQHAHVGIELGWDPSVGQSELSLALKKARKARRMTVYAGINEATGRIKEYHGTPMYMELPEPPKNKKSGGRK